MWSNYSYLIIDLLDQYMDIVHNNETHISSVSMHVGMVDMHRLCSWPFHLLFYIYYNHTPLHISYMTQIYNY